MQERANEIFAPSSLSHLIGQGSVIAQVSVAIDAAFADDKRLDHALLVGPPGLGKTALANVLAAEMATEFHEVLGQSISSIADLNAVLLGAKDKDVIHIDECHEMDKELSDGVVSCPRQAEALLTRRRQRPVTAKHSGG